MNFIVDFKKAPEEIESIKVDSNKSQLTFIDLFAGLGGFHVALESLGAKCVFAAEKDIQLNQLYKKNHIDLDPDYIVTDITQQDISLIPEHEVLCAGFPCQPFSKAGKRKGMKDPNNGDLFNVILNIIDLQKSPPSYLILENVPNILTLENGKYWNYILAELESRGYEVDYEILSPLDFGIPQNRKRVFIVASLNGLVEFSWPEKDEVKHNIDEYTISKNSQVRLLSDDKVHLLKLWQEFLDKIEKKEPLGFPVWATEFGANYPVNPEHPLKLGMKTLSKYRGSFGKKIVIKNELIRDNLPVYVRDARKSVKPWKESYIMKNRALYEKNKSWLDGWKKEILKYPHSLQKFEWNCQFEERILENKILQFRPSGVRVKSKCSIPTLVAMNMTQVPYFPWLNRYMSIREGLALQGLGSLKHILESNSMNYKALGNAVNSDVVRLISKNLLVKELNK